MDEKGKILIIDDEPDLVETMKSRIVTAGYSVDTAHDGITGVKMAKEKKPNLILLDIMMPGIDGFETLKRLKEDDITRPIPVVIFSCGSEEDAWAHKALKLGSVGYVVKPFDASALLFTVEKFLKK